MNKLSSLFVLICLGLQTASAQGLQDKNLNPAEIPGRTPIPKLLPGHTDQERWGLVTKNAPKLIGMKQSQVTSLFGKGIMTSAHELSYQITKPQKTGELVFVELRVKFISGTVAEYSVLGVWR